MEISETTREGSSLLKLSDAAEAMGFKTIVTKMDLYKLYMAPLLRIPGHSKSLASDRWYLSLWLFLNRSWKLLYQESEGTAFGQPDNCPSFEIPSNEQTLLTIFHIHFISN